MNYRKNDNEKPSPNHIRHLMHMVLCCGLPLLILLVLPLIGYKGVLLNIVPFICPIMMLVMVPMMLRGQKGSCHDNPAHVETKSIEEKQQ